MTVTVLGNAAPFFFDILCSLSDVSVCAVKEKFELI
jgi:hypothetical protein